MKRINWKNIKKLSSVDNYLSVDINRKVISDKFKHIDKSVKYSIGYAEDDLIRPLPIALPQMSDYVKYFQNSGNII